MSEYRVGQRVRVTREGVITHVHDDGSANFKSGKNEVHHVIHADDDETIVEILKPSYVDLPVGSVIRWQGPWSKKFYTAIRTDSGWVTEYAEAQSPGFLDNRTFKDVHIEILHDATTTEA